MCKDGHREESTERRAQRGEHREESTERRAQRGGHTEESTERRARGVERSKRGRAQATIMGRGKRDVDACEEHVRKMYWVAVVVGGGIGGKMPQQQAGGPCLK